MVEKIFFQSSLPRSGSTLLQNLLGQNPDFYVTPTSGFLELLYAARGNYTNSPEFQAQDSELMKNAFSAFCKHGMFGYFNSLTNRKYVVDKSRGWGYYRNFLDFFYPDPKIVCMIRDLRCIFSSMEKQYRKNIDKSNNILSDAEMKNITTEQRIDYWASGQPVGLALHRLHEILKQNYDNKILFIKYENLTTNPEKELKKIYDYFEIDYYSHNFQHITQITSEDDKVYGIFGDHTIRTQLEASKSDYNVILGSNPSNWIKNNYSWFYDYFKYN